VFDAITSPTDLKFAILILGCSVMFCASFFYEENYANKIWNLPLGGSYLY
jgi:hypothetical protein